MAKQRLSEILRAAEKRPQVILNRERPVAVILNIEEFAAFAAWRRRAKPSIANAFEQLRTLCVAEDYEWPSSDREDRASSFTDVLDELSG